MADVEALAAAAASRDSCESVLPNACLALSIPRGVCSHGPAVDKTEFSEFARDQ